MQNETQTTIHNTDSAIEDLALPEVTATQVQGGSFDTRGRQLLLGTDTGVYRNSAGHTTFTVTFGGSL